MPLLDDLIRNYITQDLPARRLSEHTVRAYKADLGRFAAALSGTVEIDTQSIRSAVLKVANDLQQSPATARRRIASVRAFLRWMDREISAKVFASATLSVRPIVRLPRSISRHELSDLIAAATSNGSGTARPRCVVVIAILIMAATGLRVSELCGLRVKQVDLAVGQIRVLGKGARERVVIITSGEIRELIKKYLEVRSPGREPDAPLLINGRGRPVTPQYLRQRLRVLSTKAGLSYHVTPHMLRHTAATLLIEGGVDIRYVQRLLGHASIATTQIYTYVSDVALRAALERANVMQTFVS